jgi:hypothetical protein
VWDSSHHRTKSSLPLLLGRAGASARHLKQRRRRYRSAEGWSEAVGKATDLIAFVFAVFFFCVFSPKIACQAPKPSKPVNHKEIHLAF